MKDTLNNHIKKGFGLGVGFFLGISGSALMAVTVSGIVHIFFPGQAISSAQVNENFASLKSAIETIEPRYSTGETLTAKVWTDGKPIYRIVREIVLSAGGSYQLAPQAQTGVQSTEFWVDSTNISYRVSGVGVGAVGVGAVGVGAVGVGAVGVFILEYTKP